MALMGKSSKSLVKRDLQSERAPAISVRQVMFQHKASLNDTQIDLLNLTTPPEALQKGFVQPNASVLGNLNLQSNYKNMLLVSSDSGILLPYISYTVSGNKINLIEPALENEIFVGIIDPVIRSDSLVADVDFILVTGELAAGQTDISIGKKIKVNLNPTEQEGAVSVEIDGQVLLRNVGNATASPSADGDYEEVPDSSGVYSSLIRLNEASDIPRAYKIKSNACSVIRPDGSLQEDLERLQGIMDKVVEVLADVSGLDETDLQAAPSQQQLRQFGDRVLELERYKVISSNTTLDAAPCRLVAADTSGGSFTLTLPVSPSHGDRIMIMDAKRTFGSNNLTIGRNGNNIAGIADDLLISANGEWVELVFISTYGWSVRQ